MNKTYYGRRAQYSLDAKTLQTCVDFAEVATACFNQPWEPEKFMEFLRDGCAFSMMTGVLTDTEETKTIGFAVFQKHHSIIGLISFGVHPRFQNHGLGRQMLQSFVKKAESEHLDIRTIIRDSDVAARKILLSLGFEVVRCEQVAHEGFLSHRYFMEYRCHSRKPLIFSMNGYDAIADEGIPTAHGRFSSPPNTIK